ncbi:MAG: hypothetical protein GX362_03865 [Methanosarcinaceae archaeon]|nr:hypothetical protein [Methanosarcinaceae archaeon]
MQSFRFFINRDSPDRFVSSAAVLSMLLEVSGIPKPGNVSRFHNFSDTSFEHFLHSAAFVPFVFQDAFNRKKTFGELLYDSVKIKSERFGGNTHFGTFLLLIPLCMGAGSLFSKNDSFYSNANINANIYENINANIYENIIVALKEKIAKEAHEICKNTSKGDSVFFYKSFWESNTFANEIDSSGPDSAFDLKSKNSESVISAIEFENADLFSLMKSAKDRDLVANEWFSGFSKSLSFSKDLDYFYNFYSENTNESLRFGSAINSAISASFLKFLAETPDTLIASKHGISEALEIKKLFSNLLKKYDFYEIHNLNSLIPELQMIDALMVSENKNPGSLADIASAGIFLSILGGLKF